MVLDLGGGTVDVTVHEVMEDGTLKELHKASGGAWGGTKVDASYFELFSKVFGPEVMENFKTEYKIDHLDMERDFELKKRSITKSDSKVNIRLSATLAETAKETAQLTPQDMVVQAGLADKMSVRRDRMTFNPNVLQELFDEPVNSIIEHVKRVRTNPKVDPLDRILLVGGFSESPLIRNAIKKAFPDVRVVAPDDPGLAVVKGAVIFGHSPNVISSRVVRYTYGIAAQGLFREGVHPPEKKVESGGEFVCKDLFSRIIGIDSDAGDAENVVKEYEIVDPKADVVIDIIASEKPYPIMVTDDGCSKIGQIMIKTPIGGWRANSKLRIELGFGGTEFKVKATELQMQIEQEATFDFLS